MKRRALLLALSCAFAASAFSWGNHAQLSYIALDEEAWASEGVKAESLDSFLAAEKDKLPALLESLEAEARRTVPSYRPRPDAIAFTGKEVDLRLAFIHALRMNPKLPMPLYAQLEAGAARDARPDLAVGQVDLIESSFANPPFKAVKEGESLSTLEVLSSASDEPDYGMDLGLFEDNPSETAALYGFGPQPFGNPALSYGSQAPIHMTFAHEDPLIKLAASFTRSSLADWRFRTCTGLARFAFAEGHDYWGWRFAGWAMHYLQDLAMPYHARMIPGKSTFEILWIFATQSKATQDGEMILLSNRHVLLEDYLYGAVAAYKGDDSASVLFRALNGEEVGGAKAPELSYRDGYLFDVVSKRAYDRGRAIDSLTVATFPKAQTSDPGYDLAAAGNYHIWAELQAADTAKAAAYEAAVAPIFQEIGASSRAYASWVRDPAAPTPPRKAPLDLRGPIYILSLLVLVTGIVALVIVARSRKRRRAA